MAKEGELGVYREKALQPRLAVIPRNCTRPFTSLSLVRPMYGVWYSAFTQGRRPRPLPGLQEKLA